jgi:hypothetical protein
MDHDGGDPRSSVPAALRDVLPAPFRAHLRMHAELLKLGIAISRAASRNIWTAACHARLPGGRTWRTMLRS